MVIRKKKNRCKSTKAWTRLLAASYSSVEPRRSGDKDLPTYVMLKAGGSQVFRMAFKNGCGQGRRVQRHYHCVLMWPERIDRGARDEQLFRSSTCASVARSQRSEPIRAGNC